MFRPAPFYFMRTFQTAFCRVSGPFPAMRRYESLEIHKVFRRLSSLPCRKISRCPTKNHFLKPAWVFRTVGAIRLCERALANFL
jgi:hypothetical protein